MEYNGLLIIDGEWVSIWKENVVLHVMILYWSLLGETKVFKFQSGCHYTFWNSSQVPIKTVPFILCPWIYVARRALGTPSKRFGRFCW